MRLGLSISHPRKATAPSAPLNALFERAQLLMSAVSADVTAAKNLLAPLQAERLHALAPASKPSRLVSVILQICLTHSATFAVIVQSHRLHRLPHAIETIERSPLPWVDRNTIEDLLGVGSRRAQQILSPLATQHNGSTVIVDRTVLLQYLRRMAAGETAHYEQKRRQRLWREVERDRRRWAETPPAFVEVSPQMLQSVYKKDFDGLPEGVELSPGCIRLTFDTPDQALKKLLALAMAIGQNRDAFDDLVQTRPSANEPFTV